MFSKETYINRRNKLVSTLSDGVYLFLGNKEVGFNYEDNQYPFHQDSCFLYYFGLDAPDIYAVIDTIDGTTTIYGEELTIDDIVWTGFVPSLKEKSALVGVETTKAIAELRADLQKALAKGKKVNYLPPYRAEHTLAYSQLLDIPTQKVAEGVSEEFIRAVVNMRIYKSEEEIAQIDHAVDVSVDMHVRAMQIVRPGVTEREVMAAVQQVALAESRGISFPVIATVNGQTLHNHGYVNELKDGQMLLLDAGAETLLNYAGDLSSTIPVGEDYTERQKAVYDVQVRTHLAAVEALRPGVPFRDVHMVAAKTVATGMKELGLMKGDPEEAAATGAYALFMPHGLGHMMGLDVHDMENLGEVYVGYDGKPKSTQFGFKSLRLARPLEPGFCLTIEPGIYFIPQLIDLWRKENKFTEFINYDALESWRDFSGIRNEEDYLITADGARRLGNKRKPLTREEVLAAKNS